MQLIVGFLVEQRRRNHMAQTILSLLRTPLYHFSPQSPTILSSQLTVLPKPPFSICLYASNSYPISLSLLSSFFCLCFSLLSHMLVFLSFFLLLYSFFLQRNLVCLQFLPFSTPFCSSQSHNKSLVTSFILSAQVVESSSLGMGERNLSKLWTAINNCNFFLSLSQCPIDLKFCSLPHVTIR